MRILQATVVILVAELIRNMTPLRRGIFVDLCRLHTRQYITDNDRGITRFLGGETLVVALAPPVSAAIFLR